MKRTLATLAAVAAGLFIPVFFLVSPAQAATPAVGGQFCSHDHDPKFAQDVHGGWHECKLDGNVYRWTRGTVPSPAPSTSSSAPKVTCDNGWYVNDDETKLMAKQQSNGMLFDGPSLVHHKTSPVSLTDVPTDGSFQVVGSVTGNRPLFKMETSTPYSTLNKTGDGKFWSSKITSGPGSQGSPVNSPADLVGKTTTNGSYSVDTKVVTFGVGYANDTGNKALISSVTFGGKVYPMVCPSPSPTRTVSPSTPVTATLPVTGSNVPILAGSGLAVAAVGSLLFFLARRRRNKFVIEE